MPPDLLSSLISSCFARGTVRKSPSTQIESLRPCVVVVVMPPALPIYLYALGDEEDVKTELAGSPKLGWFKVLKDSARNCTLTDSRGLKLFSKDRSTLISFGPITVSRPSLP